MEQRHGYGFSPEAKKEVHMRAGQACEFPNEPPCPIVNTGKVNHLEGAYVAFLDHKDKSVITDPDLNALMLCQKHDDFLEAQQRFQVDSLLAERWKLRGRTLYERKQNTSTNRGRKI